MNDVQKIIDAVFVKPVEMACECFVTLVSFGMVMATVVTIWCVLTLIPCRGLEIQGFLPNGTWQWAMYVVVPIGLVSGFFVALKERREAAKIDEWPVRHGHRMSEELVGSSAEKK